MKGALPDGGAFFVPGNANPHGLVPPLPPQAARPPSASRTGEEAMSDIAVENTEPVELAEGQETEPTKDETDWKSEARKWENRAKENSLAAAKLAEIEEANKTEAQRLSERAEQAEKALQVQQLESARAQVALEKGLTANQAKRLVGASRDEFLADADQLIADLGKQVTGPRADPSQGPKAAVGEQSPAEALADIIRQKRGQ